MKRWLFTAISFAAVLGVSIYAVRSMAPNGVRVAIPIQAHILAFLAFVAELSARSLKLTWSAKAMRTRLPFGIALRTSLGGDFAASITPARAGAEPARYFILSEAAIAAPDAMVILYAELFFEMISLAIVVVGIGLIFHATSNAFLAMMGVMGLYAAFVIGVGVLGVVLARRNTDGPPPPWARRLRLVGKRWVTVQRWLNRMRTTVDRFKQMHYGWGALSLLASVTHIGVRFTVLPLIVFSMATQPVPIAPLVIWPFGIIYGAGVVPAPGGGGAVELAFRASLGGAIPRDLFAPSLMWWRFYTFYIYIILGAMVAGNAAIRAVREAEDEEQEFERGD